MSDVPASFSLPFHARFFLSHCFPEDFAALPCQHDSIDDNKFGANHTSPLLFRTLGKPRRTNRRAKSFRSHCEVGRLETCGAVRMHWHVSHIDKCCSLTRVTAHKYEYRPAHTRLPAPTISPPLSPPTTTPVTATPTRTGYDYFNHHVIYLPNRQWPVFLCHFFARTSYRDFRA
jgi:hypothetical protein